MAELVVSYLIMCFFAGRLMIAFLAIRSKANEIRRKRIQKQHQAHSIALAEWLREPTHNKSGR